MRVLKTENRTGNVSPRLAIWVMLVGAVTFGLEQTIWEQTTLAQPPNFGGGPPGGGFGGSRGGDPFGGGPPQGGGDRGSRGGDRGGDRGSRGGDRGGRGGFPGGGFDPSSFLSRLDRNGNGTIDPDEQQGPASFLIRRLESIDPKIKSGSPISVSRVTKAFEEMRNGGGSGDDRGRSRGDDRGRGNDMDKLTEVEMLVPGFGEEAMFEPVLGFGPQAEILAVPTTPEDLASAREVLARYDKNNDRQLGKDEISSRFWGNPMDFDRNRDGKLSETELAVRNATRRTAEESQRRDRDDRSRRRDDSSEKAPVEVDFNGRKSYRVYPAEVPEGTPRFFQDRDLNGDGQIVMSEYTSEWTNERIAEYYQWDTNQDGVITLAEVNAGVNRGVVASDAPRGILPANSSMASTSTAQPSMTEATSSPAAPVEKLEMPKDPPSEKMMKRSQTMISRYDQNGDSALTASEWKDMIISPAPADFNGDGRVTVLELAAYSELKWQQRKK